MKSVFSASVGRIDFEFASTLSVFNPLQVSTLQRLKFMRCLETHGDRDDQIHKQERPRAFILKCRPVGVLFSIPTTHLIVILLSPVPSRTTEVPFSYAKIASKLHRERTGGN